MNILVQQEFDIALEEKLKEICDKQWVKLNRQVCGTIRLCLANDQKYFVMKEAMAKDSWKKLKMYMTKSIDNRLYSKKKLLQFYYKYDISMREHVNFITSY